MKGSCSSGTQAELIHDKILYCTSANEKHCCEVPTLQKIHLCQILGSFTIGRQIKMTNLNPFLQTNSVNLLWKESNHKKHYLTKLIFWTVSPQHWVYEWVNVNIQIKSQCQNAKKITYVKWDLKSWWEVGLIPVTCTASHNQ